MNYAYICEQCGHSGALCVSAWGYVAALCDECLRERDSYVKLPALEPEASGPETRAGA